MEFLFEHLNNTWQNCLQKESKKKSITHFITFFHP